MDRARELMIPVGTPTESGFGASASDANYNVDEYVLLRDASARGHRRIGSGWRRGLVRSVVRGLRNEARHGIAAFLDYALRALTGIDLQEARANAAALPELLLSFRTTYCGVPVNSRLGRCARPNVAAATGRLSPEVNHGQCLGYWLSPVGTDEATEYLISDGTSGLEAQLTEAVWLQVLDDVFDTYFALVRAAAGPQGDSGPYGFEPFPTEVLFDVRVIHGQIWRLMDYARGELVKPIPLGPRESWKVSVRIRRGHKAARTSEATCYETLQETGQTTKGTAEVVSEAFEKIAKSLSAEASGAYGPLFQARVSGSLSSEVAESSKDTNSELNKKMQKTASLLKRDRKVTVSTEFEETFEESRSSELVNPNDEVAVTYLYHRLQQRNWPRTQSLVPACALLASVVRPSSKI